MAQVIVRNIDDDVPERLRAARPSREELVAEMESIREAIRRTGKRRRYPSAEELIREDRDRR